MFLVFTSCLSLVSPCQLVGVAVLSDVGGGNAGRSVTVDHTDTFP